MTTATMVMWAAKGGVVLACAALASLLLGKAPASLRHLIWTAALTAVLVLPMIERAGLGPRVPVAAAWLRSDAEVSAGWTAGPRSDAPVTNPGTADASMAPGAVVPARLEAAGRRTAAGVSDRGAVAEQSAGARERQAADPRTSARRLPWPAILTGVWLAGALGLLGATLRSALAAGRLTLRARPGPRDAQRTLQRLARDMGIRGRVRLVVADVQVPATWGLRGGTVVLPESHVSWSAATLRHVLLHELAHIERRDCLSHLIGDVARAVHWYDPLMWLAVHRQRVESERACDDRVLEHGGTASAYAEDLLRLVRALRLDAAYPPRAALAMARTSRLGDRLGAILDGRRARGRVRRAGAASVGAAALALTLSAAGVAPEPPVQDEPAGARDTAWARYDDAGPPHDAAGPHEPVGDSGLAQPARSGIVAPAGEAVDPPPQPPARARFLPAQSQELCVFRDTGSRSTNIHMDDDVTRIRWETDSCRVDIDLEGDVEFTADDTGVARMAAGALFEVEERIGSDERRARYEGGRGGSMERRYWVDGDEVPWGPEADRWIAAILPELFRHTTINAEARVGRMLTQGGPEAVLAEVALIRSDHVASTYLELLMEAADLGEADLTRVIDFAGRLDSDHTSAELLLAVVEQAGLRPGFQDPLLRAAEGLDSDHEKGRVLETLLRSPQLAPAQLDAVVRSAATIESDHTLSQVLSTVAERGGLSTAGRTAFLETLGTIESDHSQGVVVDAFLDAGPLSGDELSGVLTLTRGIDSDHERGRILQRVARDYELTGAQVTAYLESARELDSDHEAGGTARGIIERSSFSSEHLELVLSIAEGVGSDHELAGILEAVVRRRPLEPSELLRVLEVASGLGSDHQRSAVLTLMAREQELGDDAVLAVIESASGIGSDHNRSEVLLAVAERHPLEGPALERYRELAQEMSRHYEDRLLAALVR